MSLPPKPAGPPPYIVNVMSKLNNIKSNINSIKSNINNLKSHPTTGNSGKNAKIKYLDEQIKRVQENLHSYYDKKYQRITTLKKEGKTDDEILLDEEFKTFETLTEIFFHDRKKLEEEKKAVIMSGGKTRRNKRKNRKTRKSN